MSLSHSFLRKGAYITYDANSFIKVEMKDLVGSKSRPSACNAQKYMMYSKSCARQRFTIIDFNLYSSYWYLSYTVVIGRVSVLCVDLLVGRSTEVKTTESHT